MLQEKNFFLIKIELLASCICAGKNALTYPLAEFDPLSQGEMLLDLVL